MKVEEFMKLPLREILRKADRITIERRPMNTKYTTRAFLDDAVATVEWTARTKDDIEMSEIIANSIADGLPKSNYPE